MKFRLFISSVQSEFAVMRQKLARYIRQDALLGKFFNPFLFEETPACNLSAQVVYLDEVRNCDVYLALLGQMFGNEVSPGVSATECEYDLATELSKPRLVFVQNVSDRETAELHFVKKVEHSVVRKSFCTYDELQLAVYAALVRFLEQKGFVRIAPFDLAFDTGYTLDDIDPDKVADYLAHAREAHKITIPPDADANWILGKLDAVSTDGHLTNAAVLLFAREPQRKFMSSEVKCLHYWGTHVERPIPSYKTYEGGIVKMIESALEFVMSRIDRTILEPDERGVAPALDELPRLVVREAIVNAVCHRDYESSGSVQVMLFGDRLEIINPGSLPRGWTVENLLTTHDSNPRNETLARALDWAGFVERSGHGTEFIVDECTKYGLKTPEFRPDPATFHTLIWRRVQNRADGAARRTGSDVGQSNGPEIGQRQRPDSLRAQSLDYRILVSLLDAELSRKGIADVLGISVQSGWYKKTISRMLEDELVERTIKDPARLNSRFQKYRLTEKARALLITIQSNPGA